MAISRRDFLKKLVLLGGSAFAAHCGFYERTPSLLQDMADDQYDYTAALVQTRDNRLDNIQEGVYLLTVQHVYQVNETRYQHYGVVVEGTATAVSGGNDQPVYLLTNVHNLTTREEEEVRNGSSDILSGMRQSGYPTPTRDHLYLTTLESKIRVYSGGQHNYESIGLIGREAVSLVSYPVAENGELDVAVIQCTFPAADSGICQPIGNDEELRLGQELWISGFAERRGCRSLKGILSGFFRDGGYSYQVTDIDATAGQSGGPVFALRDGVPELVGLVCSNESWRFAGFRGISQIRQWLEDIELSRLLPQQNV